MELRYYDLNVLENVQFHLDVFLLVLHMQHLRQQMILLYVVVARWPVNTRLLRAPLKVLAQSFVFDVYFFLSNLADSGLIGKIAES